MIGKNSERIQIIISKKEAELIKHLAEKERRSVSSYVSILISDALKKKR